MKPKKRRKRTQKRIQKRMKWGILISLVILAVAAVAAGIQGMKKSETETAAGKIESSGRASQQGAGESTESAKILDNTGISNTVEPQESANAEAKQEDGKTPENTGISDQAENEKALINSLCEKIDDFNVRLNIPKTLKEFGINEDEFKEKIAKISELAVGDACTGSNPRAIDPAAMEKLFTCTYYGTEVDF